MTDENKIEVKEAKTCFCQSEWFKKFLTKTLAVFVGTFCALSLFSALHRPKMPPCPYKMMRPAIGCQHHFHHFEKGPRHGYYHNKRFEKCDFKKDFQRDGQKPVPVRVNVQAEK